MKNYKPNKTSEFGARLFFALTILLLLYFAANELFDLIIELIEK